MSNFSSRSAQEVYETNQKTQKHYQFTPSICPSDSKTANWSDVLDLNTSFWVITKKLLIYNENSKSNYFLALEPCAVLLNSSRNVIKRWKQRCAFKECAETSKN